MELATIIQKAKDLVAAVRAGQYITAAFLVLELIQAFTKALVIPENPKMMSKKGAPAAEAVPVQRHALMATTHEKTGRFASHAHKRMDDLIDDIERCCGAGWIDTQSAIETLSPMFLALLTKLWGFGY